MGTDSNGFSAIGSPCDWRGAFALGHEYAPFEKWPPLARADELAVMLIL